MTTLNRAAAEAMVEVGVHAATDVTGFGLLGHLGGLLRASGAAYGRPLGAAVALDRVPFFDGAVALAGRDVCAGGSRRNLSFAAPHTAFAPSVPQRLQLLLADAQTSGGLLIAVPEERRASLLAALGQRGVEVRAEIGQVVQSDAPARIAVA
jgi:selenide,water dikinase